jgi:hypothetical protein
LDVAAGELSISMFDPYIETQYNYTTAYTSDVWYQIQQVDYDVLDYILGQDPSYNYDDDSYFTAENDSYYTDEYYDRDYTYGNKNHYDEYFNLIERNTFTKIYFVDVTSGATFLYEDLDSDDDDLSYTTYTQGDDDYLDNWYHVRNS